MKGPKKVIASIYRMYEKKNMDLPYFRTCMTMVGPIGLSILMILGVFDVQLIGLFGVEHGSDTIFKVVAIGIYFGCLILAFYALFNKEEISKVQVNERQIQAAKKMVPILFLILIITIAIIGIIKGIEKGTIKL